MGDDTERLARWILGRQQTPPYSIDLDHEILVDVAWAADEITRLRARVAAQAETLDNIHAIAREAKGRTFDNEAASALYSIMDASAPTTETPT